MFYFTLLTCLIVVTSSDGTLTEFSANALGMKPLSSIADIAVKLVKESGSLGFISKEFEEFSANALGMKPLSSIADIAVNLVKESGSLGFISKEFEGKSVNSASNKAYVNSKFTPYKWKTHEEKTTEEDNIFMEDVNSGCNHFNFTDEYVGLVTSMIPLNYPECLKEIGYMSVVDDYNRHLEKTHNHSLIWLYNDNIKSDIRRTFELAKLFGPEFQRKYDFISTVESNEDEILNFLEFAKKNADIIKESVNVVMEKLKTSKENMGTDKFFFTQSKGNAQRVFFVLMTQLESGIDQAEEYKMNKETEEANFVRLAEAITKTEAKIDDQMNEQADYVQQYNENVAFASKVKAGFASLDYILGLLPLGCLQCIPDEYYKHLPETLNQQWKLTNEVVSMYSTRAGLYQKLLDRTDQQFYNMKEKLSKEKDNIANLIFVKYYMEIITEEADKILPYINKSLESLNPLMDTFDSIIFRLESLITKAREAKGSVDKEQYEQLFNIDISTMQTDWNSAYSDIISTESCVHP